MSEHSGQRTEDTGRRPLDLRALLRLDAIACAASGAVAVLAASPVADLVGVDTTGWVRGIGAFLVVYGAALAVAAVAPLAVVRAVASTSAAGDALWVAATLVLVATGAFSAAGVVVVLAMAAVVATLGVLKARALVTTRPLPVPARSRAGAPPV
jgi:hypothetical protein